MIADPFRLFDCCQETDGGAVILVTSAERARDLRQRPVYIMAGAMGGDGLWGQGLTSQNQPEELYVSAGHAHLAKRLYAQAGVGPGDVDVALLYDHFTGMVILQLEDYGFCARGEGCAFVASGADSLAARAPAGEHARRQPVQGLPARHDARDRGRAPAARRGRQPGCERGDRAGHRGPEQSTEQLVAAAEVTRCRFSPISRASAPMPPARRSGTRVGGASCACSAARPAGASASRPRRDVRAAGRPRSDWPLLPGTGTVFSYTIVHHAAVPSLGADIPYNVVVVALDGAPDARLISNLLDVPPDEVAIGLRVAVAWDEVREDLVLPRFRRAAERG